MHYKQPNYSSYKTVLSFYKFEKILKLTIENYTIFEINLWQLLRSSNDFVFQFTIGTSTFCTSKRLTHFNSLTLFNKKSAITKFIKSLAWLIIEKTYWKYFGASNIKTTVLPILNWPSSWPFSKIVPCGSSISSKCSALFTFPTLKPCHLLVCKLSSM